MQPMHVSLHGLSLDECEAKIRDMIDTAQEAGLADYEIMLVDHGADPDAIAAELARQHAELVRLREAAIAKMRAMVARDGKTLQ